MTRHRDCACKVFNASKQGRKYTCSKAYCDALDRDLCNRLADYEVRVDHPLVKAVFPPDKLLATVLGEIQTLAPFVHFTLPSPAIPCFILPHEIGRFQGFENTVNA